MVVDLFPAATAALPWHVHGPRQGARQLIRTTALPFLPDHHYVRTPWCLLLTSQPRRARAAGLLLRLPASHPEQATASSVAAGPVARGWRGGRVPRSVLSPPAARMMGSRAMAELCWLIEGGSTALKALPPRPCRLRRSSYVAVGAFKSVMERVRRA